MVENSAILLGSWKMVEKATYCPENNIGSVFNKWVICECQEPNTSNVGYKDFQ